MIELEEVWKRVECLKMEIQGSSSGDQFSTILLIMDAMCNIRHNIIKYL
jgi:hypothetical protein